MHIVFNDDTAVDNHLTNEIYKAAEMCLKNENIDYGKAEISISFVSNDEIRSLNAQYRNNNCVTDVLSFPQYTSKDEFFLNNSCICLGDVVISLEKAEEQAIEFGHSKSREVVYLIVHSIFHLLGYDHMNEEERVIMRIKEEDVMNELQLGRLDNNEGV